MDRKLHTDPKSFKPFGTFSKNSFNIRASNSNSKLQQTLSSKTTPVSKSDFKIVSSQVSNLPGMPHSNPLRSSLSGSENTFCSKLGNSRKFSTSIKKHEDLSQGIDTHENSIKHNLLKTPEKNSKRRVSEAFHLNNEIKEETTVFENTQILQETSFNYALHEDQSINQARVKDSELEKILSRIEKGIGESEVIKVRMCFMNILFKSKDTTKLARFLRQRGATPNEMMIYNDLYANDLNLQEMKTTIMLSPEDSHKMINTTLKEIKKELGVKKSLMRRGSKILLIEKETPIIEAGNLSDQSVDEEDSVQSISSHLRCHCVGKNIIHNPSPQEEELCYSSIPKKVEKYKEILVEKLVQGTTSYLIEDYMDLTMRRIYVFFVRRTRTWGFYFIPKISLKIWDFYVPILLEKEDGSLMEFSLNPRNELFSACKLLLETYDQQLKKEEELKNAAKLKEIKSLKEEIENNKKEWSRGYGFLSVLQPVDYFDNMIHRFYLQKKLDAMMR